MNLSHSPERGRDFKKVLNSWMPKARRASNTKMQSHYSPDQHQDITLSSGRPWEGKRCYWPEFSRLSLISHVSQDADRFSEVLWPISTLSLPVSSDSFIIILDLDFPGILFYSWTLTWVWWSMVLLLIYIYY